MDLLPIQDWQTVPAPVGAGANRQPVAKFLDGPAIRIPSNLTVRAARQIAALKRVRHLMVSEGTRVVGLLCVDDLSRAPIDQPVWKWARRSLTGVSANCDARQALEAMDRARLAFLPVTAGSMVIGIVTREGLTLALGTDPRMRAAS